MFLKLKIKIEDFLLTTLAGTLVGVKSSTRKEMKYMQIFNSDSKEIFSLSLFSFANQHSESQ